MQGDEWVNSGKPTYSFVYAFVCTWAFKSLMEHRLLINCLHPSPSVLGHLDPGDAMAVVPPSSPLQGSESPPAKCRYISEAASKSVCATIHFGRSPTILYFLKIFSNKKFDSNAKWLLVAPLIDGSVGSVSKQVPWSPLLVAIMVWE